MLNGLREVDRVLRGEATTLPELRQHGLTLRAPSLPFVLALLAASYGICMGFYGLFGRTEADVRPLVAAMLKVPTLFALTLLVTFPSLYVFNVLIGAKLTISELGRLLGATLSVLLAVLVAFGPIVAFFSVTTVNYPFILLLNVGVFGAAGVFGMSFLARTLNRLASVSAERSAPPPAPEGEPPVVRIVERPPTGNAVFWVWIIAFALVGTQMSWVLRPFLGAPELEFTWFRPRSSSFFQAVGTAFRALFP